MKAIDWFAQVLEVAGGTRSGAAVRRLGESMPRLAAEPQRPEPAAAVPGHPQAVPQGRGARRPMPRALFRLAPYVVFGAMVLAAAIIPSMGTRLPFTLGGRRDRAGGAARHGAGIPVARRDGRRHRLRHAGCAPRDDGRFPRRAGAADGDLRRLADLVDHGAAAIAEQPRDPAARALPESRLHRRRLHDGAARGECAHPGRQSGDPPRADHDPRGACCSSTRRATWR